MSSDADVHRVSRNQRLWSVNHKAELRLRTELSHLSRAEQHVTHGISVQQRITYRRHRAKLDRAALNHARILGDRQVLRALLSRDKVTFNTNSDALDSQEQALLDRIRVSQRKSFEEKHGPGEHQSSGVKASPIADTDKPMNIMTSRGDSHTPSVYVVTGPRPSTKEDLSELVASPVSSQWLVAKEPKQKTNIFDNEKGPTLLDLHRRAMRTAAYGVKVSDMCDRLQVYRLEKRHLLDYYSRCVETDCATVRARSVPVRRPRSSSSEARRATGSYVRSLTLRTVDIPV